ncbi:hypothetical protein [Ruegeria atlantica]|uniref:hypothetical protein n=1 Tax=Ruegeria atlantica TaxID=81569 RepID=UPI00147F587A|nr:hypothetical protein [Ruegeria atlantica]
MPIEIHLHHKGEEPPEGAFITFNSDFVPEVGEEILVQKPESSELTKYVVRERRVFLDMAKEEAESSSMMLEVEVMDQPASSSFGGYEYEKPADATQT